MKSTITIQIGNSDDKLTQNQWAEYIGAVEIILIENGARIHFSGGSDPRAVWQNFCWCAVVPNENLELVKTFLTEIRVEFQQDSLALTVGETFFV